LSEGKKLAIQIANLDGLWSLIVTTYYIYYSISQNLYLLFYVQGISFLFTTLGLWFMSLRMYDSGRAIMHLTGLIQIYLSADAFGVHSGAEFYYFTSIAIPFVTFTFEEQWKGNILTAIACIVLLAQQFIGSGIFMPHNDSMITDKVLAITFVMSYFLIVFGIGRRQLKVAQEQIKKQQDDLIHSSNLMSLGEMAAGIAHEINNPLQALSLQLMILKDMREVERDEHIHKMNGTILRMARMVQGLKDLSRKDTSETPESVLFNEILDDVLLISGDRIKEIGISLHIVGDPLLKLLGHSVQISQVMINLLNNSIDAIRNLEEKWIRIDISEKNSFLQVCVTDSGKGISEDVASKMMNSFYTTKRLKKGTGLGLSISKSIIEKNNGSLYYDASAPNTRFVLLLPLSLDANAE
jgi:signal transduction histidine kinase